MSQDLVDLIYEAAFVPDRWPGVLEAMGQVSGSVSGAILVMPPDQPPRWRATANVQESLKAFATTDAWRRNERGARLMAARPHGFTCADEFLTPEQLERDSVRQHLEALGLGWQLGLMLPMPGGEVVTFTLERRLEDGAHAPGAIEALDQLRPHLARAGMLAARLGLERARTTVATLAAVGYAAAIVDATGRALAVNPLLESLKTVFRLGANDRLTLADPAANVVLQQVVAEKTAGSSDTVRSMPVHGGEAHGAFVVHVLPLTGAAHDIFSGATALVVATSVGVSGNLPTSTMLHALFDLSPAEARIAIAIACGRSLRQAGVEAGIRFSTARSYLEQIFRKTGVHQQSQLVALIKNNEPPFRSQRNAA